MILLIDNYDSFSYNLYQLIGAIEPNIKVIRNDEFNCRDIAEMKPTRIIISPGPGRPKEAGICETAIDYFKDKIPILGVCLGHQAICETFGGSITYAKKLMHGKQSIININNNCKLFKNLSDKIPVARYHSLTADINSLPECLEITAISEENEVMAVAHKSYEIYGVQFHPESILTDDGLEIIRQFINN